MTRPRDENVGSPSGAELIVAGLALALLGAGAVMLMVIGFSLLYVGQYTRAALFLVGFLVGGVVFGVCYGPYLNKLERRTGPRRGKPPLPADGEARQPPPTAEAGTPTSDDEKSGVTPDAGRREPVSTAVVIAIAASAYGLLIMAGGLIWTRGLDLIYNVIAGAALLGCALLVGWAGHRRTRRRSSVEE